MRPFFALSALIALSFGVLKAEPVIPPTARFAEGILEFPAGTHLLEQTIEIHLAETGSLQILGVGRARLVMDGPGPAIRLIGTHDGTASPATVGEEIWLSQNAPRITNLEIIGSNPKCDGIELTGTMQPTLDHLTIRRTRHAIRLVNRNRNVTISDCHLYENDGAGVYYDHVNLHQSNITGSHISYNAQGGVVIRGGDVRNVHVTGCDIEGNMSEDGEPTANVLLDADDGSIGEVAITGCTIQHDHKAGGSANIRMQLKSPKREFADELRHGNITISGNVLSDTAVNIDIAQSRGVAITGNTIWKGYEHNIRIRDSTAVTLASNVLDRNDRYHYGDGGSAKLGITMVGCSKCTLVGNVLSGVGEREAAIDIFDCDQINILGCTVTGYPKDAIALRSTTRSTVSSCTIAPPTEGGRQIRRVGDSE